MPGRTYLNPQEYEYLLGQLREASDACDHGHYGRCHAAVNNALFALDQNFGVSSKLVRVPAHEDAFANAD